MTLFDILDKHQIYEEETRWCIRRISSAQYPPVNMLGDIVFKKALKRVGMVNMNWWLEIKTACQDIIDMRKWYARKDLPF